MAPRSSPASASADVAVGWDKPSGGEGGLLGASRTSFDFSLLHPFEFVIADVQTFKETETYFFKSVRFFVVQNSV
jgi:hypothetical protein